MRSRWMIACLALGAGAGLVGCEEKAPPTPANPSTVLGKSAKSARDLRDQIGGAQQQQVSQAEGITGEGNATEIGGVLFPIAGTWQKGPSGGMRAAVYLVSAGGGEAECVFFTGIGGSADSNINRWKGQVSSDPGGEPRVTTDTIDGIKVTQVSMVGTYRGMSAGGAPSAPQPGTRFLGAIVEGPRGPIQVRLTGPAEVVDAAEPAWKAMIFGLRRL